MKPDIMFDHIAGEVRVSQPFKVKSADPEKVVHAVARALCHEKHGDWRYDPGRRKHAKYRAQARRAMRELGWNV